MSVKNIYKVAYGMVMYHDQQYSMVAKIKIT